MTDERNNISPYDYAREMVEAARRDFDRALDHERRYRKQYGQAAADAVAALAPNGWVSLKLENIVKEVDDLESAHEKDMKRVQEAQTKIFVTAFALLISILTLLITVIFGMVTGG